MLAAVTDVNLGVVGDARRRDDRATGTIGGSGEHHTRFYVSVWTASGRSGNAKSRIGVGGFGVLDRAHCHRLVAWFSSGQTGGIRRAEESAVAECARLNLKHGDPQEEGRMPVPSSTTGHTASNQGGQ